MKKIVITGGTGQVGTILARAFHAHGEYDDIVVIGRNPKRDTPWRTVVWDGRTVGPWADELSGSDVVINLAGYNVNCRYHEKNRRRIMDSRIDTTRLIGKVIATHATPAPRLWLQASTATIYAHTFGEPNDDVTGVIGGNEPDAPSTWRFSIEVATAWERAAEEVDTPNTRKVLLRSAMTMSPDRGGIFDVILRLVRLGLGGKAGNGKQFVSWVHEHDFVQSILWLIEHDDLSGPINIASPNPLPYAEFIRAIRKAWGMPIGLPATKWMLELGAVLMRTETELVLKSRRVVPRRLLESGFAFDFPRWPDAADDLCRKRRAAR
ncbi:MAG: TIGR01777 family protein [Planctomycetes bacterium]|nr:TIGR01777 family protein [Planctomycetota bacterium]NOG54833.1 TIGR01777 family protein [Planctomycetota bacterium]